MADRTSRGDVPHARAAVRRSAIIAAVGGLLFGYDTGIIAGALLFIEDDISIGAFESGLIVAAVPLGAIFGAAGAGRLGDRFGRRRMIVASAIAFAVGSLVCAFSDSVALLVIGRLLLGLAVGVASTTCPVYISEVAPTNVRGRLVTLFQLAVTAGILVAYLVSLALTASEDWRLMLGLGAIPAVGLGLGMWFGPQSPRWLVMRGRVDDARRTLSKMREGGEQEADAEIEEIQESLGQEKSTVRDLVSPAVRAALFVGVGLAILQQVTGINTVIYYAPTIVQFAGVESDSAKILATVGIGVVNVGATVFAIWLVGRMGRRPLLLLGVSGMVIALVGLGAAFQIGGDDENAKAVVAVVSLMAYVSAFAISLGPIFWLLNAEIYPLRVRAQAAGIATMANWTFNFIVSLTFLLLIDAFGQTATFWLYAGIGVLTLFFVWRFVPETRGVPLEEMEAIWRKRGERRGGGGRSGGGEASAGVS